MSAPIVNLSLARTHYALGSEEGYDLWFDLPPAEGDDTTPELQTLCQGSILLGRLAARMGWDWTTLVRNVDHVSAPLSDHLLIEVGSRLFRSARFRTALAECVPSSGLDPYKVKIIDTENANVYILGHGLPAL